MESILESMETIDDDCDVHGVHFVKISDPAAAYHYGVSSLPTLVYFKNKMPNIFEGEEDNTITGVLSVRERPLTIPLYGAA